MEEYENWFEQAKADLTTANNSHNSKDFYASCFWSQQAVEKSLKSLIIKNTKKLQKTHDLIILSRLINLPEQLKDKIKSLSGIHVETRYGIIGDIIPAKNYNEKDSKRFMDIAQEVLLWIKEKI